ncbi:MAG: hypothetical protein Q7T81_10605 [Pseudolabrys sp.]|nr:hypothetical protein [Pseudolabrys sp.]
MSDPRYTDQRLDDPRNTDPNFIQPGLQPALREESSGGVWGWVAGLAVVALIAFVVLAGWNNGGTENSASAPGANPAPLTTTNSGPVRNVTPPSTTGSGSTSPMTNPAPSAAPAPAAPAAPAQQ